LSSGRGWEFFSSLPCPYWPWGPPIYPIRWIPGALSLGVKQQEHEADHLLPPCPPLRLYGVVLS